MDALEIRDNDVPAIADDFLIAVADQAEKRIDAVMKIKRVALKVTNAGDWVDQSGKPYLMASGSEKVANLFNISWQIDEPTMDTEGDGAITYTYKGRFTLGGRSIDVEGSRSSRDTFFKKYEYVDGKQAGEKPLDRRDLKMAALTNLLGNGITRILGIRNLTWEDVETFTGFKRDECGIVNYRKKGESKPPVQPSQSKSGTAATHPPADGKLSVKETLRAEITAYIGDDTEEFKHTMKQITAFGDNSGLDNIDNPKFSDKWAGSALKTLRKLVAENPPSDKRAAITPEVADSKEPIPEPF